MANTYEQTQESSAGTADVKPRAASSAIPEPYTFNKSQELFQRSAKVIPCGLYGHMSPVALVPTSAYPFFAEKGEGACFTDVDGNEFIDYGAAYGPMALGYNHPVVDEAAAKQQKKGNAMTAPGEIVVELAEYMVDSIPVADWALFAKNGGDLTAFALMVAREATGKKKFIMIKGCYHGVHPWVQTPGHPGTQEDIYANVIHIPWNDTAAFEKVVEENKGEIAAFMATPYHHPNFVNQEFPAEGYYKKISEICKKEGIIHISDDVRTGFRVNMEGSNEHFGYKPDLIVFCKAMANCYPISAIVGTDELRNTAASIFYTGSYWYSAVPMAAALATLKEMKKINAPKIMQEQGRKLLTGLVDLGTSYGYNFNVDNFGMDSMPYPIITNDPSRMLHQDW
ncbi:MAG: aminotransferase class III-fold pyridoxal phosphate-dependent enzyme, partial [bacterium]|nr:aminotransferase class III-fold pyridoxal phosphate-dependent enzyme [bacterium]